MIKNKLLSIILVTSLIFGCLIVFLGCNKKTETPNIVTDTVCEDTLSNRISFDKKYYFLGYTGYTQNEYYTFFENGSATYTHIMKDNDETTYHQELNFKWTYLGDGNLILIHNGTKMIKGTQDDVFGFSREFCVSKDVVYWSSTTSDNTYFISEDFTSQIPSYAKFIENK